MSALQKRWQASFLSGDGWGLRGGGSAAADRDAALRLTFGLIVRMYAYDDALRDLAEQDPTCLEAFAPQVGEKRHAYAPHAGRQTSMAYVWKAVLLCVGGTALFFSCMIVSLRNIRHALVASISSSPM